MVATFRIFGAAFLTNSIGMVTGHAIYSGLYIDNGLNGYDVTTDTNKMPEAIYTFYVDKVNSQGEPVRGLSPILVEGNTFNSAEDYYVVILGKGSETTIFDFSKVIPTDKPFEVAKKDSVTDKTVADFYTNKYTTAINQYLQNPDVSYYVKKTQEGTILSVVTAILFGILLIIVVLPLFNKNGVTLGEMIMKTTVSNKFGFKVNKGQALIRGIASVLINYFGAFLLINLVSFGFILFSKKKQSLVDLLAATLVLDKQNSLIFADVDALRIYNNRLKDAEEEIENNREKTMSKDRENHGKF